MSTVKEDTAMIVAEIATIELIKDVKTSVDNLAAAVASLSTAHADTAAIVAAIQPTLNAIGIATGANIVPTPPTT